MVFDGKDWPSGHGNSLIFVTDICPECGWLSTGTVTGAMPVTTEAFVMLCLLPQCDSAHILWLFWSGIYRTWTGLRPPSGLEPFTMCKECFFLLLPREVAFLVLFYLGLYVTVHLFAEITEYRLGWVVEGRGKACWMVKKT